MGGASAARSPRGARWGVTGASCATRVYRPRTNPRYDQKDQEQYPNRQAQNWRERCANSCIR